MSTPTDPNTFLQKHGGEPEGIFTIGSQCFSGLLDLLQVAHVRDEGIQGNLKEIPRGNGARLLQFSKGGFSFLCAARSSVDLGALEYQLFGNVVPNASG